jgi:hypothetical protein
MLTFHRTSRSLFHHDWIPFALGLAQIFLSLDNDESANEEWDHLFGRKIERQETILEELPNGLSDDHKVKLSMLTEVNNLFKF